MRSSTEGVSPGVSSGDGAPEYFSIGRIEKPHGVRGEVVVALETDYPERIQPGLKVRLIPPDPGLGELTVEAGRASVKGMVIKFERLDDRTGAERLAGRRIAVPAGQAVQLPRGAHWIHDIIGLEVFTQAGQHLGRVEEVLRTGGNDVYVVRDADRRELLVPALKTVVQDVDIERRRIVIEPPAGLLE